MTLETNPLLTLAIVLVAAVASGSLAQRLRLPAITGQILIGVLLGPSVLNMFEAETIHGLRPITHFALGLVAVTVGSHLNLKQLRNATKRLLLLLSLEAILTPALVFISVLYMPDTDWYFAALLATMAISTAPATIISIVKETRSKGVFVKTLVAAVALNNIACICLFEFAHTAAYVSLDPEGGHTVLSAVMAPIVQLASSALLGGVAGAILVAVTRRVIRAERLATASIITILLTAGLADFLGISALLSCLILGVTLANLTPEKEEVGHAVFSNFESAIFAVFFTLAGMEMDFQYAIPGGLMAILLVATRIMGKVSSSYIAMKLAGATDSVRRYLGMALVPQAGIAVGLILLIQENEIFPVQMREYFLAVGLTAVMLSEIIGPILTRYALVRSGEFGMDRARLIDFLHEENIDTNFTARNKEEAIEKLTDLLIRSNRLNIDRDKLLNSVMERERDFSTCFGEGLAIPHGTLEEGSEIIGAMGISREGLDIETPDGIPVHCMILLATPVTMRNRHLEVLAAFAKTIGSDRNIQRQLFNAKSSAHAYDLLHAEELEDYNYFLED